MKFIKIFFLRTLFLFALCLGTSFALAKTQTASLNIDDLFSAEGVEGSLFIFDANKKVLLAYHPEDWEVRSPPASTFKILNSMILLKERALKNEQEIIPWDGTKYAFPGHNQDHNIKTAYRDSALWFYEKATARLPIETYSRTFKKMGGFGDNDISSGVNPHPFWIGSLTISPKEQLHFLQNLYTKKLPFSNQIYKTMQDIMIDGALSKPGVTVRAKTGWSVPQSNASWTKDLRESGWYIGYIEKEGIAKPYFFVIRLRQEIDKQNPAFLPARKKIVEQTFKRLGVL